MFRLLIVEDDDVIAASLAQHLTSWGYEVCRVTDFKNVMQTFETAAPQLVLLDIMLPFYNGFHWCSEIRKSSKVPVIFISSASDNMNIVMAMNMGGDDFIAKPFDLNVLVAKLQALLRRTYDFGGQASRLECEGMVLNTEDASLMAGHEKVELTKNEYRILQMLLEQKGHIVSRDALMTRLWESDAYVDENTLTVNVTRLRKKLEGCGKTSVIKTKKGMGYIIE